MTAPETSKSTSPSSVLRRLAAGERLAESSSAAPCQSSLVPCESHSAWWSRCAYRSVFPRHTLALDHPVHRGTCCLDRTVHRRSKQRLGPHSPKHDRSSPTQFAASSETRFRRGCSFFTARRIVRPVFRQVEPTIEERLESGGRVTQMNSHGAVFNFATIAVVLPSGRSCTGTTLRRS